MKVTEKLKAWLVDKGVAADSSDDEFGRAAAQHLSDYIEKGEGLSPEQYRELSQEEEVKEAHGIKDMLLDLVKTTKAQSQEIARLQRGDNLSEEAPVLPQIEQQASKDSATARTTQVDVKGIKSMYSNHRTAALYNAKRPDHIRGDAPVKFKNRQLEMPGDLDKAVCGAVHKWCLNMGPGGQYLPRNLKMTEHDEQLVAYAINELPWVGFIGGDPDNAQSSGWSLGSHGKMLSPQMKNTLMDDTTSGGVHAVPRVFDDQIILDPILHSEVFGLVDLVDIPRGRTIDGSKIDNPTLSWGGQPSATNLITLETTAGFIQAFDTLIRDVHGGIEISMDFEEDTPIAIGEILAQRYGEKLLEQLDRVVMVGNNTTEPDGVLNATSINVVLAPENGPGGAPTVGDYEALLFAVPRRFTKGANENRCVFVGTQTSYERARSIPVGGTDQRRVFGMETNTHRDFRILGYNYAILDSALANSITNAQLFFGCFQWYRMYRRLGGTPRVDTQGKALARANTMLLTYRGRFGGQVARGEAFSQMTNAQA